VKGQVNMGRPAQARAFAVWAAVVVATGCGGRAASEAALGGGQGGARMDGDASADGMAAADSGAGSLPEADTGSGAVRTDDASADGIIDSGAGASDGSSNGGPICPLACRGKCCDALGRCQEMSDTQCGPSRTLCMDCTQYGGRCSSDSYCVTADGGTLCSQTCIGCCDATGTCQSGFADTACGQLGGRCDDCAALEPPSTCDLGSYPRACVSQQTQCPAPYSGCPQNLQVSPPDRRKVCSAAEIEGAAAACANGTNTLSCTMYMDLESRANVPCRDCLAIFDVDFASVAGVVACSAPYLDVACNHESACLADCVAQSCDRCLDGESKDQCATQAKSGGCSAYTQSDACMGPVLNGAGSACNPAAYPSFGEWLAAVAALYCAP
jgi:hypothetical protein